MMGMGQSIAVGFASMIVCGVVIALVSVGCHWVAELYSIRRVDIFGLAIGAALAVVLFAASLAIVLDRFVN